MKHSLQILNIKCNGCKNTISKSLRELGATEIEIDLNTGNITFEYTDDITPIREKLLTLGYPEMGSKEATSLLNKMTSYVSCALGKVSSK